MKYILIIMLAVLTIGCSNNRQPPSQLCCNNMDLPWPQRPSNPDQGIGGFPTPWL